MISDNYQNGGEILNDYQCLNEVRDKYLSEYSNNGKVKDVYLRTFKDFEPDVYIVLENESINRCRKYKYKNDFLCRVLPDWKEVNFRKYSFEQFDKDAAITAFGQDNISDDFVDGDYLDDSKWNYENIDNYIFEKEHYEKVSLYWTIFFWTLFTIGSLYFYIVKCK